MRREYEAEEEIGDPRRAPPATITSHSASPKKAPQTPRPETVAKKAAFLAAYREMGVVSYAARTARIARETAHRWRREDETFAQQFAEARADAADKLEREAMRRAVEGIDRPVIHRGQLSSAWIDENGQYVPEGSPNASGVVPLTMKEYSDTLLIFLLKAACPEKYRDRYYRGVPSGRVPSSAGDAPSLLGLTDNATTRGLAEQILTLLDGEGGAE
jgi:hypothetical protein